MSFWYVLRFNRLHCVRAILYERVRDALSVNSIDD